MLKKSKKKEINEAGAGNCGRELSCGSQRRRNETFRFKLTTLSWSRGKFLVSRCDHVTPHLLYIE